jgi:hypothetical protein
MIASAKKINQALNPERHGSVPTAISPARSERERLQSIYASPELYPRYGHDNQGSGALALVQKWGPLSIVDVGCGWNEFCLASRAAIPGVHAVGVDFACPGADVTADAIDLPFSDKQFDVLTAFDMLQYLQPGQVDTVFAELARISHRFVFSICHRPSVTTWQGENLHPSVFGETWWMLRIMRAGGSRIEKRGRYITGEWQPPLRIDPDAKVILVGNGPSLLHAQGEEIDTFDEIVRFNDYQLAGFEQHVGTRTTLWSTFGRKQASPPEQRPDRVIWIHGESGQPGQIPRELYRIPLWFYHELRSSVQRRSWWMSGFAREPGHLLATSGLIVAAWLLQVVGVKKVTLAGFDHFSKEKSRQHHYWLPQSFGKPKEHDGAVEAVMFAELRDQGRVTYL